MGIDLGALLQGAITGARGIQEGIGERRQREQQALRQALADRLLNAQIGNYESLMAERARSPEGGVNLQPMQDPVTGEVSGYNPRTNTLTPSGGRLHPKPQEPRPPNADQTRLADFGTRMLEGHQIMAQLESQNPGIGQRVDAKIRPILAVERLPGVGGALASAGQAAALATMTPEEQAYWSAMQDLGNARLRRASGAQINKEEYEREIRALVPLAGEAEGTVRSKQQRRLQAAKLYIRGAGSAFQADLLSPEARAYLDSLEIPTTKATRATATRTTATTTETGYNPKFWRP